MPTRARGTIALVATLVGALAVGRGGERLVTLIVLFAGLTLAGHLFGVELRHLSGTRDERRPNKRRWMTR